MMVLLKCWGMEVDCSVVSYKTSIVDVQSFALYFSGAPSVGNSTNHSCAGQSATMMVGQ